MFYMYEHYNLDMILMADHIGCKNTKALNGMFREKCRERNIPLLFLSDDMSDTRVVPHSDIKKQVDEFMETIMKIKPLKEI